MGGHSLRTEQGIRLQSLDHRHPIVVDAVNYISQVLGHMQVHAHAKIMANLGRFFERFIADGERGMKAKGSSAHRVKRRQTLANVAFVLSYPLFGLRQTVPVADLVT